MGLSVAWSLTIQLDPLDRNPDDGERQDAFCVTVTVTSRMQRTWNSNRHMTLQILDC